MTELVTYVLEDMNKQLERIKKSLIPLDDDSIWKKIKHSTNFECVVA